MTLLKIILSEIISVPVRKVIMYRNVCILVSSFKDFDSSSCSVGHTLGRGNRSQRGTTAMFKIAGSWSRGCRIQLFLEELVERSEPSHSKECLKMKRLPACSGEVLQRDNT